MAGKFEKETLKRVEINVNKAWKWGETFKMSIKSLQKILKYAKNSWKVLQSILLS